MLQDALETLLSASASRDVEARVKRILQADDELDAMEARGETHVMELLSLQQPLVAEDVRFVSGAFKTGTDLERVGDLCVNIARTVGRMAGEGTVFQGEVDMARLGRIASVMLHDTVTAFVRNDIDLARQVVHADDEADVLYQEMRRELHDRMRTGVPGAPVVRASYLLFVAHYLERVGDHCVNIAERIIYTQTGAFPVQGSEPGLDEHDIPITERKE
jgi:phosphate transport system protein